MCNYDASILIILVLFDWGEMKRVKGSPPGVRQVGN